MYAALSIVTFKESLHITGSVSAAFMKANPQAKKEYNRMHSGSVFMVDEV